MRSKSARISLEILEDRTALATMYWAGTAVDNLWSEEENWRKQEVPGGEVVVSDRTPGALDAVVFWENYSVAPCWFEGASLTVESIEFRANYRSTLTLTLETDRLFVGDLYFNSTKSTTTATLLLDGDIRAMDVWRNLMVPGGCAGVIANPAGQTGSVWVIGSGVQGGGFVNGELTIDVQSTYFECSNFLVGGSGCLGFPRGDATVENRMAGKITLGGPNTSFWGPAGTQVPRFYNNGVVVKSGGGVGSFARFSFWNGEEAVVEVLQSNTMACWNDNNIWAYYQHGFGSKTIIHEGGRLSCEAYGGEWDTWILRGALQTIATTADEARFDSTFIYLGQNGDPSGTVVIDITHNSLATGALNNYSGSWQFRDGAELRVSLASSGNSDCLKAYGFIQLDGALVCEMIGTPVDPTTWTVLVSSTWNGIQYWWDAKVFPLGWGPQSNWSFHRNFASNQGYVTYNP